MTAMYGAHMGNFAADIVQCQYIHKMALEQSHLEFGLKLIII